MSTPVIVLACIGGAMLYAAMAGVCYRWSFRFIEQNPHYTSGDRWFLMGVWPLPLAVLILYYLTYWLVALPLSTMARLTAGKK